MSLLLYCTNQCTVTLEQTLGLSKTMKITNTTITERSYNFMSVSDTFILICILNFSCFFWWECERFHGCDGRGSQIPQTWYTPLKSLTHCKTCEIQGVPEYFIPKESRITQSVLSSDCECSDIIGSLIKINCVDYWLHNDM